MMACLDDLFDRAAKNLRKFLARKAQELIREPIIQECDNCHEENGSEKMSELAEIHKYLEEHLLKDVRKPLEEAMKTFDKHVVEESWMALVRLNVESALRRIDLIAEQLNLSYER